MAREQFIDSLRRTSRMLASSSVSGEQGAHTDAYLPAKLYGADLWLTPKSVEGFDPADFADRPKKERQELSREVAAFRAIAEEVPANKAASKAQSREARKHLEQTLEIVREPLVHEWLEA